MKQPFPLWKGFFYKNTAGMAGCAPFDACFAQLIVAIDRIFLLNATSEMKL
jgi:hypothetical protein